MQTCTNRRQDAQDKNTTASTIIQFVELVKNIQSERRKATNEEMEQLADWMGWGPVAPAFETYRKGHWAEVGARLHMLLGPEGAEAASEATPHSFFTDRYIADALWKLATGLGFDGGKVLEPGCGSGAVISAAPSHLKLDITGIEREPFSASVAQARFPNARIIALPLEKTTIVDDSFDLVVGNVPFSSAHIYDRDAGRALSLHNYFIWRSMQALRPGGLAILITSRYTLDAQKDAQRDMLRRYGNLLGAIRLPSGTHKAANTEVVTDLLVLQKRSPEIMWKGHDWMGTTDEAIPGVVVNEYFQDHLISIIGTPAVERGMYRDNDLKVHAPENIPAALNTAIASLINEVRNRGAIYLPPIDRTIIGDHLVRLRGDGLKEGSYHVVDRQLVQIIDGEATPVPRLIPELTALVQLRDAAVNLLEAERDFDRPDDALLPLRRELNTCYDAYLKTYGPIHRARITIGPEDPETGEKSISRRRPASMYAFSKDPDYCVVLGLEDYDDTTQQAHKAPIFSQRIHVRPRRKTLADSPGEALALCLDEHGKLDLCHIGRMLSIETDEVPEKLGDLVYEDPESGDWQPASEYLSGNVRDKVEEARRAVEGEPERYGRNVTALEAVMPEDLLPEEIKAILGAPWIATGDIEQFCFDTFGLRPVVSHERLTGGWQVTAPSGSQVSAAATSEWGTTRVNAYRLVELGLNKSIPIVYDTTYPDETKVKNVEESLAAQEKLRAIQVRFSEWVWEDNDRATRLAAVYNRTFNSIVPRHYDGSHLTFPGMSEQWQNNLYSWQKDFVWRMVSSTSALCGHPVGAGKTTTEIAGAMTLRRMGLTSKAAVIVPNHLLEQITAEAQRLYPGANILMVSRDDLNRDRRKLFAARIATGNYDFVVMTHSGLGAIGVHPETEKAYIDKRIAAYKAAMLDVDEDDKRARYSIKKLETAVEKMRQRQEELLDKPRDDGVTFEQLGVSYFIVDEAHLFKNLGLPTNIQGLQVKPAKRATDLEMKLRWLEEHNEGRPFAGFFTATPLSNSMVEAYVLAWYLAQELICDYGLRNVDAFASVFIEFQTRVEVSPNGASFRLHTRPARFVNVPEFLNMFTQFADLRGPEILSAKRPQRREHIITIEPSDEVQAYVDELVVRSEEIQRGSPRSIGGKQDNMLWVTSNGRMAALDLSLVGLPQEHSPKLQAVASNMLAVYDRWQEEAAFLDGEFKSLQIGFCDLGTPNEDSDQVYGKLKLLLMASGIPAHGIRSIHEAKSDSIKAQLFQQCRSGQVAILLGSTAMLGTGTNIQTRGAALHHIDAPWRPDEVEQREGRVQRPGNLYPEVEIFRYVQRRTFDAYSWQTLANKAVFFDQMRSGKLKGREVEELGDSALSYGQVKAAATGDPLVLEQADLNVIVAHLQRLRSAHLRARHRDAQEATIARNYAADTVARADRLKEIVERAASTNTPGFTTTRGRSIADRTEIGDYIAERFLVLLNRQGGQEWLGHWSGTEVRLQVSQQNNMYLVDLLLGGASGRNPIRLRVWQDWIAKGQRWRFAHAIEQLIANADSDAVRETVMAEQSLARANDFEIRSREPFLQEEALAKRLARKNELDAYTALVAAAREDSNKRKEVEAARARLLTDAPNDFSEVLVAMPAKIAAPRRPQPKQTPVIEATNPRAVESKPEPIITPPQPMAVEPLDTLNLTAMPLFADLTPVESSARNGNGQRNGKKNGHDHAGNNQTPASIDIKSLRTISFYELFGLNDEATSGTNEPIKSRRPKRVKPTAKATAVDNSLSQELVIQRVLW